VRERGQGRKAAAGGAGATPFATISNGENVVVVGLKSDGTTTARVVVVLPNAGGKAKARTPAPAQSSGQA
jgi:orotate phosphoribosyltransferase-like protein